MYGGGMYGGGMGYGSGMYGPGPMGPWDPNDPNAPPQPPSAWQAMLHAISGGRGRRSRVAGGVRQAGGLFYTCTGEKAGSCQPSPAACQRACLACPCCSNAGVVHFFGRLSFLVDENAHAVHFFISALLQLLDRCGGGKARGCNWNCWRRTLRCCRKACCRMLCSCLPALLLLMPPCPALRPHFCRFGSLYGELARFVLRLLGFKPKDKKAAQQEGPPGAAGPQQQQQQLGAPAPALGHPAAKPHGLPGMPGAPARPGAAAGAPGGGQWDSLWQKDR